MTKKDLVLALSNIDDNAEILFGAHNYGMGGSVATRVYYCERGDGNDILITNEHTDKRAPMQSERIYLCRLY